MLGSIRAFGMNGDDGIRNLAGLAALAHPFGTDVVGRDILARTIYGGQISLLIGIAAVGISLLVGVPVGALSGYYGGVVDSLLRRSTEAVLTIPPLFLLIVAAKFLGDKLPHITLGGRLLSGSVGVLILVLGLLRQMFTATEPLHEQGALHFGGIGLHTGARPSLMNRCASVPSLFTIHNWQGHNKIGASQ